MVVPVLAAAAAVVVAMAAVGKVVTEGAVGPPAVALVGQVLASESCFPSQNTVAIVPVIAVTVTTASAVAVDAAVAIEVVAVAVGVEKCLRTSKTIKLKMGPVDRD